MKKPVVLIIMDGYGLDKSGTGNAVSLAKKPHLDHIFNTYSVAHLNASGEAVGLPEGQMGNSEVGHLNIGAGRIVYQSLTRINLSIKDGSLNNNEAINKAINHALENNKKFHIFGLASNGGVHSHTSHIIALANLAYSKGIKNVYYHAFLDGRDVPPKSACEFLDEITNKSKAVVATVSGRYYAMDRDKNWNRIQVAYDTMTQGSDKKFASYQEGINASYSEGVTDEFMYPFVVREDGLIEDGDSIVFANFRPDRAIQIATAFSNPEGANRLLKVVKEGEEAPKFDTTNARKNIFFVSMMKYADSVDGLLAFDQLSYDNLYGDVLSQHGLRQLRIAETEKYAHVTFFFDGGKDRTIPGADRILVNSPKVATYDLQPEMSAYEVTDKVIEALDKDLYDAVVLNYANCDMVGHTGVVEASIKAVEAVDECVGRVYEKVNALGGVCLITADHGNAEKLVAEDGSPFTAHTTNLVPVVVTKEGIKLHDGALCDIAPTLLQLLGIEQPKEMTGKSLID